MQILDIFVDEEIQFPLFEHMIVAVVSLGGGGTVLVGVKGILK